MDDAASIILDRDFLVQVSSWGPLAMMPSPQKVAIVGACAVALKQYVALRIRNALQPGTPGSVDPQMLQQGLQRAVARASASSELLLDALERCCPVQTLIESVRSLSGPEKVATWKAIVTNAFVRVVVAPYVLAAANSVTALKQTFLMGQSARVGLEAPVDPSDPSNMLMALLKQLGPLMPAPEDEATLRLDGLMEGVPAMCQRARDAVTALIEAPSIEGDQPYGLQEYVSAQQLADLVEDARAAIEADAQPIVALLLAKDVSASVSLLRDVCATRSFCDVTMALADELWLTAGVPVIAQCVADSPSYDVDSETARMVHCAVTLAVSFSHGVGRWVVPFPPLEGFCQLLAKR